MEWKKRGNYTTLDEYVIYKIGTSDPDREAVPGVIAGLDKAARELITAVRDGYHIAWIGDYDVDGISSLCESTILMRRMGAKFSLIVPRRLSEGYGINLGHLDRIQATGKIMVVTVDNGITGHEVFAEVRKRGWKSMILDHHTYKGEAPDVDVLVDPEYDNNGCDFDGYCGAGLMFRLIETMYPNDTVLLNQAAGFAALGTVADIVPLVKDNRRIVKYGLNSLNNRMCVTGLNKLLDNLFSEKEQVDSKSIGFCIGPCMNAPGRLNDLGGQNVITAMFSRTPETWMDYIVKTNDFRKEIIKKTMETVKPVGDKINFLYSPELPEGLCGIVASRLLEENGKPSFVVTDAESGGVKGSCRCNDDNDVYEMLSASAGLLTRFGGHQNAAGFGFPRESMEELIKSLDNLAVPVWNGKYYDLAVQPSEMFNTYMKLNSLQPLGKGIESPVYQITGRINGQKMVGGDKQTLSGTMSGMKIVGFRMAETVADIDFDKDVTIYGEFAPNWYKGTCYPQFQIRDILQETV